MADVKFPPNTVVNESSVLLAGNSLNTFNVDGIKIGLGICYDAFFPKMSAAYRRKGCDMLLFQSAFPVTAGHFWETLHRARAMDNQLYVVGTAGAKIDDSKAFVYWGKSCVVQPDGQIIAQAGDGEELLFTEIGECLSILQKHENFG